jgi:5-methylcytosine-specific restriction endonuclease McrA
MSSRFLKISTNELQLIFDNSRSISEVISTLGTDASNKWYRKLLANRISSGEISTVKMKDNYSKFMKTRLTRLDDSQVFVENSTYSRVHIKRRIVESGLIKYCCVECGIIDKYNGKPIVLDLDHINGIRDDNRLINLRFLCPNCHSQQSTSNGRNRIRTIHTCECGKIIGKYSKKCKQCSNKLTLPVVNKLTVSTDELQDMVNVMPLTKIGALLGVSDNAIKKRCIKLKVILPKRSKMGH